MKVCSIGDPSRENPTFAVWGDSHGEAIRPAVDAAATVAGERGVSLGRNGCPPLLDTTRAIPRYRDCPELADSIVDYLRVAAAHHPGDTRIVLEPVRDRRGLQRQNSQRGLHPQLDDAQTDT